MPFDIDLPVVPFGGARGRGVPRKDFPFPATAVSSVIDIGGMLGQAEVDIDSIFVDCCGGLQSIYLTL